VIVLVYPCEFNVTVTVRPFSTPVVVIATVPELSSSEAFNDAPQEKAVVDIALILGAVSSFKLTVLLL
jgi:hypothetical protein